MTRDGGRDPARPRFGAGLVLLGVAVLALTPAAPEPLRHPDLLFAPVYRPIAWALLGAGRLLRAEGRARSGGARETAEGRVSGGLVRWDDALRGGVGEEEGLVARIVEVDRTSRRLLVDAGEGAEVAEGAWVAALGCVVGVVEHAAGPLAVVRTPWTPDARFYAACSDAAGHTRRLILVGLDRREWCAAVKNPEREDSIVVGAAVVVPDVDDLLPESVPRLREGALFGRIAPDERLRAHGEEGFLVLPAVDVRSLDAVIVRGRRGASGGVGYRSLPLRPLDLPSSAPGRDALLCFGGGVPRGAALLRGGWFLGTVDASVFGIVSVRGACDPAGYALYLVVDGNGARPLVARPIAAYSGGGTFAVLEGVAPPGVGDVLATAGRGLHVERGLPIGVVVAAHGDRFDLWRGAFSAEEPAVARVRIRTSGLDWPKDGRGWR